MSEEDFNSNDDLYKDSVPAANDHKDIITDQGNTNARLININNLTDLNLPYNVNLPDNITSAIRYFLRNFQTTTRVKGGQTRKTNYYFAQITKLRVAEIKILEIDYNHLVDWCDRFAGNVQKTIEKYGFKYPFVDINKIDPYEMFDLSVYMYSKKMLAYLDGPHVSKFIDIVKMALFMVLEEFDIDVKENLDDNRAFKDTHISIKNFPIEKDIHEINSSHLRRAVSIKANLVSYDSQRKVEIIKSSWSCNNCNFFIGMNGAQRPVKCPNCGEKAGFEDHPDLFENKDFIYIKLQQRLNSEETQVGVTDLVVKVQGNQLISEFFKKMKPAANLKVTGIISLYQDKSNRNQDERLLQQQALTIEVENENSQVQYNERLLDIIATKLDTENHIEDHVQKMIRSICPHLYGLEFVKLGVLLMCVGAEPRVHGDAKNRVRGDINLLLAGDPGLGKSEFGHFVLKILPQSIRTVGGSSTTTKAALTTSVDIIAGVRVVTFGVLALCDMRGVAIIDELDKRTKEDFEILSIPMDDAQMIPTHKSGFHQDVMARCPVLLIGNPSKNGGRWDITKSIQEQTNFAQWLTSRVDLIFVLYDDGNMERKEKMLEHISKTRLKMVTEEEYDKSHKNKVYSEISIDKIENDLLANRFDDYYDTEYIRHELHYLKNTYKPKIIPGSSAEKQLQKAWLKYSQINLPASESDFDNSDLAKTNPMMDARKINSLERLAMAAARLRRHHKVMEEDVQTAVDLMTFSMTSLIPQKVITPGDSLRKSENAFKQIQKFLTEEHAEKMLEGFNSVWIKKRDEKATEIRRMLTRFNNILFHIGFFKCDACKGSGLVDGEDCLKCEGNRVIKKEGFSYYDVETPIVKNKVMPDFECKYWFKEYQKKGIIKTLGGHSYEMGVKNIDVIEVTNFVEAISLLMATQWIENERKKSTGGASQFDYEGIKPRQQT